MKAISLWQPWASLIAVGHIEINTRSWITHYRGPIAIHAARESPLLVKKLARKENALGRLPAKLPRGAIVATANLVDMLKTEDVLYMCAPKYRPGNYQPRRWAWVFKDVHQLDPPIFCKGAQGLWEVDIESLRLGITKGE